MFLLTGIWMDKNNERGWSRETNPWAAGSQTEHLHLHQASCWVDRCRTRPGPSLGHRATLHRVWFVERTSSGTSQESNNALLLTTWVRAWRIKYRCKIWIRIFVLELSLPIIAELMLSWTLFPESPPFTTSAQLSTYHHSRTAGSLGCGRLRGFRNFAEESYCACAI